MNLYIMAKLSYLLSPIFAWLVSGIIKFIINSIKTKSFAFEQIGYGGFPSTHTAIATNITALIALKQGVDSPEFGIALTLMLIIIIDAIGLRRQIGRHAQVINQISMQLTYRVILREKMGHKLDEVLAGLIVGCITGYVSATFMR